MVIALDRDDCVAVAANSPFAALVKVDRDSLSHSDVCEYWVDFNPLSDWQGEHVVEFLTGDGSVLTARIAGTISKFLTVRVLATARSGESLQLHHKQRLETLGLLAGGVAHDFNNVLTGILGHVAYLKHVLPKPFSELESLAAIEEGSVKAAELTQQILNFSKTDASGELKNVDVDQLVSRISILIKSAIPSDIKLRIHPSDIGFTVLGSEVHISQILINLIINARDAISGGGFIDITSISRLSEDEVLEIFGSEPASPAYGALEVADTGSGMSDEVKQRLFEPYFTTKEQAGTGLGLATVNSIVTQLGGAIQVFSEQGQGTLFKIILPLVGADLQDSESTSAGVRIPRGCGERILVIDDEDAVRNVLGLSLSHLGYEVETVASGFEGIERVRRAEVSYHLVILDLLMPGLSGEETFNRLKELDPGLVVLIVSGFSSEHVVQRVLADGARDFIQKPFSIEVLSEKVRGCLSDPLLQD